MNATIETDVEKTAPAQTAVAETEREFVRPVVNIYETAESYVLEAELPGVSKEGVSVNVENNLLTLEGRRPVPVLPEDGYFYRESSGGDFRRVFELDPAIEAGKISARMEQGVLTLTLSKAEAAKPRRIAVA
jgi:HSP20 family molecular chaperone IbpA